MSEHTTHDPNGEMAKKRHLELVHSESTTEEHEAQLSLVFLDITDNSFDEHEIIQTAHRIAADELNPAILRDYETSTYPKVIARQVLEHAHVQPDLDEVRAFAERDSDEGEAKLTDLEKAELERGLEVEKLFRKATDVIEEAAHKHLTSDLVTALEDYMESSGSYDTNVMRIWSALLALDETSRIKPSITVGGRILKTMLYLNARDATVTPLK